MSKEKIEQEELNNQQENEVGEELFDQGPEKVDGQNKEENKEEKEDKIKKDPKEILKEELAESKEKFLRLYSEFENYRRRTSKERLDLIQTASEDLMVALLPVMDDFIRAEKSFGEEEEIIAIKEGIKLIASKFQKILEQNGLKAMEVKKGQAFDAEIHEAISQIPAPKKSLKGKIVDVIEEGYYLGDKVIRFAKVVIGS